MTDVLNIETLEKYFIDLLPLYTEDIVVIPNMNICIDVTKTTPTPNTIGYLRYEKNYDGSKNWFCKNKEGNNWEGYLATSPKIFIGGQ